MAVSLEVVAIADESIHNPQYNVEVNVAETNKKLANSL